MDINSLRDPSDDLLDRAIQALLSQPAPDEIKRRVLDRAARWTATSLSLRTNGVAGLAGSETAQGSTLPGNAVPHSDEQPWAIPRFWLIVCVIVLNVAILVWIALQNPFFAARQAAPVQPATTTHPSVTPNPTTEMVETTQPKAEPTVAQPEDRAISPSNDDLPPTDATPRKVPIRETAIAGVSDAIRLELNLPYAGTDDPRQRLDLYVPRQAATDELLPVVVIIHGTFQNVDKRFGRSFANALVPGGNYTIASIDYRLPNEAKWPAQLHDCRAAVRWIRANAVRYHLDPNRIGVLGASAGGHLAAMLGTTSLDDGFEDPSSQRASQSSRVTCIVDLFGPTDFPTLTSDDRATSALAIDPMATSSSEAAKLNSPTTYVTSDDPPFLIIHGTADRVVPFQQAELLSTALRSAGVATTLIPVEGGGHGNFRNPEVVARIRQFFDKYLRLHDVQVSDSAIEALGKP